MAPQKILRGRLWGEAGTSVYAAMRAQLAERIVSRLVRRPTLTDELNTYSQRPQSQRLLRAGKQRTHMHPPGEPSYISCKGIAQLTERCSSSSSPSH